jgi:ABC-type nitrate/sulfonate/bicarbonate transport system substrate-binding protein
MKKFLFRIRFAVFCFLVPGLFLTGCQEKNGRTDGSGQPARSGNPPAVVRIGYLPLSATLHHCVAMREGLFEKEGIKVEAVKFQDANLAMHALLAGKIDGIAAIAYSMIYTPYSQQPGLYKSFLSQEETGDRYVARMLVLKNSPITKVSDLEGKRLGTYNGLPMLINARLLLRRLGLENKVTLVQIKPELQNDAFVSGQFDALLSVEPYPTIALSRGTARVLLDNPRTKYFSNPYPAAAALFSTQFINKSPETVAKVLRCYDAAIDVIRSDENRARSYLPDVTPVSPAVARQTLLYHWRKVDEVDIGPIQKNADEFYAEHLMKNRIDVRGLVGTWKDLKR